ncbi:alpha/beta hydrolase [Natronosalvus rutilus]|uniref:Alpha/beta hydrolase n=1 Tax=Natronosalvus rutilus TaxID=2953753 RepID=A0A9E7NAY6_9EURY|nr:dienelactone hydrolase family protein [Natronosalvus rutilus]UTF53598.1 alpha/beta hydrolase [Natronosalvus rutilus]
MSGTPTPNSGDDPHGDQPVERAGANLEDANAAMILVHGRGARASGMLEMAAQFDRDDVAYLAPQAVRGTWYPQSFLAPIEANEPYLTSALDLLESTLETANESFPAERTILAGFSQGGCLASEFAARNARDYGGVVAFSGGLIGPEGTPREYDGSLEGTPAFFGCSDQDPHIPLERVHESVEVYEGLGADVTERIYEGMGHTIIEDELEVVRDIVDDAADQ